mgnify:CR=1 FL=1
MLISCAAVFHRISLALNTVLRLWKVFDLFSFELRIKGVPSKTEKRRSPRMQFWGWKGAHKFNVGDIAHHAPDYIGFSWRRRCFLIIWNPGLKPCATHRKSLTGFFAVWRSISRRNKSCAWRFISRKRDKFLSPVPAGGEIWGDKMQEIGQNVAIGWGNWSIWDYLVGVEVI